MTLVQFGAGNIGRSFIGQLFGRAGYEVVFVDIDGRIIDELNRRGEYRVIVKSDDAPDETVIVAGVRGVNAADQDAVVAELAAADHAATAVGARALAKLAPTIARALELRQDRPLDIIIAENVRGASQILGRAIRDNLNADGTELPGLVETSIGKMVPIMSDADREADPLQVFAEPYNTLIVDRHGFRGPIPRIPDLEPVDNIAAYVDRKLFIHNLGHAACAYIAHRTDPRLSYVWQALAVESVASATRAAMEESSRGLLCEYPDAFSAAGLAEHIADLLHRFRNSALGDSIYRVGRDTRRKLARDDRLIGAMRLCARHGLPADAIADAAAAGFTFAAADEHGSPYPPDAELARRSAACPRGSQIQALIEEVCGLDVSDPVDRDVLRKVSSRLR